MEVIAQYRHVLGSDRNEYIRGKVGHYIIRCKILPNNQSARRTGICEDTHIRGVHLNAPLGMLGASCRCGPTPCAMFPNEIAFVVHNFIPCFSCT